MRLVSFEQDGAVAYGAVDGNHVRRIDTLPGAPADLKSLIASTSAAALIEQSPPDIPLADVRLLPPIPDATKIFCVATNFHEPSRAGKPDPEYPLLFTRYADSFAGHEAPLLKPAQSEMYDFEGELAVVIGTGGHQITRADAMGHVAGYTCLNDGSVRDWQKHSTQFTPGKNFFRSGSMGPWLVPADEVDPATMTLQTRVNGVIKQEIAIRQFIFDIPWLIAYLSSFTPLSPGDIIATGTPSGFGSSRTPQEFLSVGDTIEVEISGIGTLRNTVQAA